MARYTFPGQFHGCYSQQEDMNQQIFKDSEKYAFAECLVWQTTRCLIPEWDFQRLVRYTPLYTDSIQKFVMGSHSLQLYSTYLQTADAVLHKYEKVLQPIVRYQKTIGYDALELLVFGAFLGFYCARLHVRGIKEAPDYAVIAIANALKFFDDTDQFEHDGWTRLDRCARDLINTPQKGANELVSTSKMGERIEQFLKAYLDGPPHVPVKNKPKGKPVSYTTGLEKNHAIPCTNGSQMHQAPYTTVNSVGNATSTMGREPLFENTQINSYQNILRGPLYYFIL